MRRDTCAPGICTRLHVSSAEDRDSVAAALQILQRKQARLGRRARRSPGRAAVRHVLPQQRAVLREAGAAARSASDQQAARSEGLQPRGWAKCVVAGAPLKHRDCTRAGSHRGGPGAHELAGARERDHALRQEDCVIERVISLQHLPPF